MRKYEVYLPLKYNDGKEIEAETLKQIREELIAAFGALTVSPMTAPYLRNLEIRRRGIH